MCYCHGRTLIALSSVRFIRKQQDTLRAGACSQFCGASEWLFSDLSIKGYVLKCVCHPEVAVESFVRDEHVNQDFMKNPQHYLNPQHDRHDRILKCLQVLWKVPSIMVKESYFRQTVTQYGHPDIGNSLSRPGSSTVSPCLPAP